MAQIDATGLDSGYTAVDPNTIDVHSVVVTTADSYQWQTTNGFYVSTLSFAGDITPALGGTVNAVSIIDSSFNPVLDITGLDVPLNSLIDTTDAAAMQEKFWDGVLAGNTTVLMPLMSGIPFAMFGDAFTVSSGDTMQGGNDTFLASSAQGSMANLSGDAIIVEAGAVLNGGNDLFEGPMAAAISGDVGTAPGTGVDGTVNGGNDTISITDPNYTPTIHADYIEGDCEYTNPGSIVHGGQDSIMLHNLASASDVYGDSYNVLGSDTCGNDTIDLETTILGRAFMAAGDIQGDDGYVTAMGNTATTKGGADRITIKNVDAGTVSGDYYYITSADAVGGDDTISYSSTFPLTTPTPSFQVTSVATEVDGDSSFAEGNTSFTGGNDVIRLSNIGLDACAGDVTTLVDPVTLFEGGNDKISYTFDRTNVDTFFAGSGDIFTGSSATFTGGDDTVTASFSDAVTGGVVKLYGDANTFDSAPSVFQGGNDRLVANTAATQPALLFGDAATLSGAVPVDAHGGDDVLIGGAGNDSLFGDWSAVTAAGTSTLVGGNDTLDGRGGNDTLDGGDGTDTARFSLHQSVYVDLNGIPGTGGYPGAYVEAIGQGYDQLISIENVTGSSRGDVIFGDGGANVLMGAGGSDRMGGRNGQDRVFGQAGNDTLNGGGGGDTLYGGNGSDLIRGNSGKDALVGGNGNDTLTGGKGHDILAGGAGNDTFDFNSVKDSTPDSNRDHIVDFVKGGTDHIDVSGIDAKTGIAGNQAFHFITGAFTGHKGELHSVNVGANSVVSGDVNGNGQADFKIVVEGVHDLGAGDFIL